MGIFSKIKDVFKKVVRKVGKIIKTKGRIAENKLFDRLSPKKL